jgi:hypothetical protein
MVNTAAMATRCGVRASCSTRLAICDYSGACNPDDFNVADLITDLGHFCDRENHNFRAVLRRALRNWEAER